MLPTRATSVCHRELHESNECDDILEKDDRDELAKLRDASTAKEAEQRTFKTMYRERKQVLQAAKGVQRPSKGSSSGSGRGGRSSARSSNSARKPFVLKGDEAAKAFLPPGAFVWRAWRSSSWIGRVPPNATHTRSWHEHGHAGALQLVLHCLWDDWLADAGQTRAECPISGLF